MTGIGEFIKVAESKGSKNKFKDTKRIDDDEDEEDDYQAAHTNSVYPQCSGDKAHVCRFGNEQISKFTILNLPSSSWKLLKLHLFTPFSEFLCPTAFNGGLNVLTYNF